MRGHPRWFKIRTRRVYKRSSRPDPPQTPLHSGSIMSLVDSSNNYNSNGQQQQGQEQQHGYLASRQLMSQDLASRHPTLLKQLNSPPTICKCSGQSRWAEHKHTKINQIFKYRQRSKTNKLILNFSGGQTANALRPTSLQHLFVTKRTRSPGVKILGTNGNRNIAWCMILCFPWYLYWRKLLRFSEFCAIKYIVINRSHVVEIEVTKFFSETIITL